MEPATASPLVDLASLGWTADRIAAALAVAGPNGDRIARAARTLLTFDDPVHGFAPWCDAQAGAHPQGPA